MITSCRADPELTVIFGTPGRSPGTWWGLVAARYGRGRAGAAPLDPQRPQAPTYKAIEELGKAVKSVFIAEYIAAEGLRREIHENLQVVENWNSATSDLFYGNAGSISGSDKEHQEVSMLCLHLLQSALVFIFSELSK